MIDYLKDTIPQAVGKACRNHYWSALDRVKGNHAMDTTTEVLQTCRYSIDAYLTF